MSKQLNLFSYYGLPSKQNHSGLQSKKIARSLTTPVDSSVKHVVSDIVDKVVLKAKGERKKIVLFCVSTY